ncbi:D-aminoacyl-tRNA deacylase [Halogranum amylolyticum]|uniref:D-aminoacyl-tRNA deacylase n=1 Tax=Halogranum amylolyticum TaxID=660520 RepID=A0A1H8PHS6_9EURY|nr:D-aminoacyl-tRNA deacylase [Halogranum amylolyticum]SEO41532.1 D-aminoacyl-tRNA deacylase [Halogranum amylolyticum]
MIAIVVSHADFASEHIGERLLELVDWTEHRDGSRPDADGGGAVYRTGDDGSGAPAFELRTFERIHVELDGVDAAFDDPDLLFFASRHSGDTGPLLTAHFTGNFGEAKYGGTDGSLARACPGAQKAVVAAFEESAPDRYDVGIECTHHGPSELDVPSMFVELGSGESEWEDPEGARAVARAILAVEGVEADVDDGQRHLVGFGGGHYVPRPTRLVRETAWGVGHIAADWQLAELGDVEAGRDVVARVFERSAAEFAVIDGEKPELRRVVDDLGYRVVSETWVREVDDRPLALVSELEAALSTVDDGLRFGAESFETAEFTVVDLPSELLQEAQGVDADATREAVETHTVAFETDQNGARASGRAAVRDRDAYDSLVASLADLLAEKYDRVERDGDVVVAHETAFDPGKAATLGVPEGPAFGKLAAGEPVEVGGDRVPPESVRTERIHRFPV